MEHQPIAEWLPERYRNVLDRIADLEAAGRHADADRIRRDAIRAYSRSWTEKTATKLDVLAERAQRLLALPALTAGRRGPGRFAFVRIRAGSAPVETRPTLGAERSTT